MDILVEQLAMVNRERLLKEHCNTWYQIRVGLIATLLTFFLGVNVGYYSSTIRKVYANELDFESVESDVSSLSNAVSCSNLLGPIIFTYCVNYYGRKPTMLLSFLLIFTQYVIVYFCNSMLYLTIALSIGLIPILIIPSVVSVYVSEVIAPHLRGSISSTIAAFYCFGSLIGLVVNWQCTLKISSMVFVIASGGYLLVAWNLPETPHYLIKKSRFLEAGEILRKLYGHDIADLELVRISVYVGRFNSGRLKDIYMNAKNRRSISILLLLCFLKFTSGIFILLMFAPVLLSQGNYYYLSPFSCEIIILCVGPLIAGCYAFLYRYAPRRRLGIISICLYALSLSGLGVYFYLYQSHKHIFADVYDIFPFLPLLFCVLSGFLGITPQGLTYFRELTPIDLIAYYSVVVDLAIPIFSMGTVFIFNYLRLAYGYYFCMVFFFGCVAIGGVAYFLFVPETHKKIIENVQDEL